LAADRRRAVSPVALGSAEADELLVDLSEEERMASWHLVAPDGRRWSAGYAAPPLLRLLPAGRAPAGALAAAPEVTDRIYRWVADHRSAFSRAIPARAKRWADGLIERRTR
jgi:predicted DCC family thiol-disulfide oxidoreductase YuxK